MNNYVLYPGEGLPIDVEYSVNVSAWTVTAEVRDRLSGKAMVGANQNDHTYDVSVTRVSDYICRFHIRGVLSTALAGKQAIIKMIAIDPGNTEEPVVDEALLTVSRV